MRIKEINLSGDYSLTEGGFTFGNYPLPYGTISTAGVLVRGKTISSKGGCWGWNFPASIVYGYGKYQPYIEGIFAWDITVSSTKDIPHCGMRIGDRKSIAFFGEWMQIREMSVESDLCDLQIQEGSEVALQGDLIIYYASINISEKTLLPIIGNATGRRKIGNHQFFGKCKIFHLNTRWLIIASQEINVVSPDYILEPLRLSQGIYIANSNGIPGAGKTGTIRRKEG